MRAGPFAAFALALVWSACSSAEVGDPPGGQPGDGSSDAAGGSLADAGDGVDAGSPDAPPLLADAGLVSLTQSQSTDIVGLAGVACFDENDVEQPNSFYRVFDLAAEGIAGPLDVTSVTFGVEGCEGCAGGLPATVVLHRFVGDFDPAQEQFNLASLETIVSADTVITDVAFPDPGQIGGELFTVPIEGTIAAGSRFVVEVAHAGFPGLQVLIMGANRDDQDGLTYTRASNCDITEPTSTDLLEDESGNPVTMHWVVVVDGTGG